MGLMSPELSLDLRPTYVPEPINGFLKEVSLIGDVTERLTKVDERIRILQDELNKIQVFQRELPHCMLLLHDAIQVLKQESTQYRTRNAHQPVLEEFIPLRKETTVGETNHNNKDNNKSDEEDSSRDKKNWMSKVQLFPTSTSSNCNNQNQTLVPESQKGDQKRATSATKLVGDDLYDATKNRTGSKGFVPMIHTYPSFIEYRRKVDKEDGSVQGLSLLMPGIKHPKQDSATSGLSSKFGGSRVSNTPSPASNGLSNPRPGHQQPTSRKQRRCWSPELHRRFVEALTQLGGPQVATPKQIRELMRVDGLTNDEVKSHLQKYRLHTRRVPNSSAASTNDNGNSLAASWGTQDQYSDSSKPSSSQSGSPQGPLQFTGLTGGTSTTGCNSMEDDDDEKSESYSWKGHVHRPGKDDV